MTSKKKPTKGEKPFVGYLFSSAHDTVPFVNRSNVTWINITTVHWIASVVCLVDVLNVVVHYFNLHFLGCVLFLLFDLFSIVLHDQTIIPRWYTNVRRLVDGGCVGRSIDLIGGVNNGDFTRL